MTIGRKYKKTQHEIKYFSDQDHLMMDEGEVAPLPYQPNAFPARPHSATVNRAVDWRGKVTPDAGKYK